MTGIYTGRSPKDKYIVMDENSKDTVWWNTPEYPNDNHPMKEDVWATVKDLAKKELCNKKLFVVDAFCGANKDTRTVSYTHLDVYKRQIQSCLIFALVILVIFMMIQINRLQGTARVINYAGLVLSLIHI